MTDIIYPGKKGAILLLDGNNAAARAGHAHAGLTAPNGMPSGALFGVIKEIKKMLVIGKFKSIIFVKDAGRPAFRVELVNKHAEEGDGYKAHRKEKRDKKAEKIHEDYMSQLDVCHELLSPFGVHVVYSRNWEADDLIASLCYKHPDEKFVVLSGDKDLHQLLLLDNVRVYNPRGNEFVEAPKPNYVLRRAVAGDSSDNIPGIRGVGEATFDKLAEAAGISDITLPNKFCNALATWVATQAKPPAAATKILAGRKQLKDYYEAMHLKNAKPAIDTMEILSGVHSEKKAHKECLKLGFKSIREEWTHFWGAFSMVKDRTL